MRLKTFLLALLMAPSTVHAEDTPTIVVADDSGSGTYKAMLGEIMGVCPNDGTINIVEAKGIVGGAPGNLDALVNNKAQAAFLHSDVFFVNSQSDPTYKRFQTLIALYPEPIHVLALRQSKTGKLGMFEFGKAEFSSLSDLKGFSLGASGGGVYTARVLKGQGDGGFTINEYPDGKATLEALDAGAVAAVLFVGAAPLPNLVPLDKSKYKLLPIGEAIANKVKGVYKPVTINYAGLSAGPISTLAPFATILTRRFSTPQKLDAQRQFRQCFYDHLSELKDNGSPNWQAVEANEHGVLDWYEIPPK